MPSPRLQVIHAGVPAAGSTAPKPAKPTTTSTHMTHQGAPQTVALIAWKRRSKANRFWIFNTGTV